MSGGTDPIGERSAPARRLTVPAIALLVALAVLAALWPLTGAGFVNLDDGVYVTGNYWVLRGLTPGGIAWAATAVRASNWHPLTWLSHMADVSLFGTDPRGHHAVSLLLHLANAVLLFLLLHRATGLAWRSAVVALLFGIHPLHVESVGWISERKDVLAAFFGLAAMLAYAAYARRPSAWRYLAVAALMAAGLASKPVLVTLPFVLLLLDWWPLGRLGAGSRRLVLEKVPLLLLSAASSAVTLAAQRDAIAPSAALPLAVRAANAVTAYAWYLGKTLWPSGLAVYYPHPGGTVATGTVVGGGALLLAVTVGCIALRARPALAVGWCWFLGMLVPMIGLVQVGDQAVADRYSYLPSIGLLVAVVWGVGDLLGRFLPPRREALAASVLCVAVLLPLGVAAHRQASFWKDSVTLFTRAAEVVPGNWLAHDQLGSAHLERGDLARAADEFARAVSLNPYQINPIFNLGVTLHRMGRVREALPLLQTVVAANPPGPRWRNHVGVALDLLGRKDEAIARFAEAITLAPTDREPRLNLGRLLIETGRRGDAIVVLTDLLALYPGDGEARRLLEAALAEVGRDR